MSKKSMENGAFELDLSKFDLVDAVSKLKEIKKEVSNKLNVLILGKTGAGKSTLINTIFGKNFAKTGSGKPITQNMQKYEEDKLCIYDSKGLEIKDEDAFDELKNFINEQEAKDPSEQIHIVWFCVCEANRRIEEREKELIEFVKSKNFCSIVVITKAQQDKDENGKSFKEILQKELDLDDNKIQRVRALEIEDDEGSVKKIIGISELINKSYNFLPEAQKNAFARKQEYDIALKRRACKEDSEKIIKYYTAAAGSVAASPIPFSDFPLIATSQCAMIYHISNIYGLELTSMDDAKKIFVALGTAGLTGFVVKTLFVNILKIFPGPGTLAGGAINMATASATTKTMGDFYIAYLDKNFDDIQKGKKLDFDFKAEEELIKEYKHDKT